MCFNFFYSNKCHCPLDHSIFLRHAAEGRKRMTLISLVVLQKCWNYHLSYSLSTQKFAYFFLN